MGRWTDDPSAVAPDGMQRIGYDSDTHRYTFRDGDGSVYEGAESGGDLRLVSRPGKSGQDDEPIRMFPTMPSIPTTPGAKSPVSPTSFSDMLPAHMIAAAPPVGRPSPNRRPTVKGPPPASSSHMRSDSGSHRSLWGVVRSSTMPARMRSVVDSVTRRPSARKEADSEGSYARLSGSRDEQTPRRASARTSQSGHAKRPTV